MNTINLDAARLTATSTQTTAPDQGAVTAKKATAALLGGTSVYVTSGAVTDLEALVERLKNESARAKFSVLLTSLNSISQSLNEVQKRALEEGLELSEKIETLSANLAKYNGQCETLNAEATILAEKIKFLQKRIDEAVEEGKEHNMLVQEMKELRKELDDKQRALDGVQDKINETKNAISDASGKLSSIVSSLGENTLKTIATELEALAKPETADRPAEQKKAEEKATANDIMNLIRRSLAEIEREIEDTIAENRVDMA